MLPSHQSKAARRPLTRGFLPDLCRVQAVFWVVLAAALFALLLALASTRSIAALPERLGPLALFVELVAIGAAALLCRLRPALSLLDDRLAAAAVWLLLLLLGAAGSFAAYQLLPFGVGDLFPEDALPGLIVRTLGICAIVGALVLHTLYLHYRWRQQVEAEADARFHVLQARIRPHFLFNSINTIASLTHSNPDLAEELLQDLADLFRASFAKGRDTTTLAEELTLARRYLHIEQQRLGDRLRVEWEVDELPQEAPLPPLILQPLIENAVYHGVAPATGPGRVSLVGRYRRGQLSLVVRNTLPAAHPERVRPRGHRMALDNVRQRLELMYPGVASVTRSQVDGEYQVRLTFPFPWSEP